MFVGVFKWYFCASALICFVFFALFIAAKKARLWEARTRTHHKRLARRQARLQWMQRKMARPRLQRHLLLRAECPPEFAAPASDTSKHRTDNTRLFKIFHHTLDGHREKEGGCKGCLGRMYFFYYNWVKESFL